MAKCGSVQQGSVGCAAILVRNGGVMCSVVRSCLVGRSALWFGVSKHCLAWFGLLRSCPVRFGRVMVGRVRRYLAMVLRGCVRSVGLWQCMVTVRL